MNSHSRRSRQYDVPGKNKRCVRARARGGVRGWPSGGATVSQYSGSSSSSSSRESRAQSSRVRGCSSLSLSLGPRFFPGPGVPQQQQQHGAREDEGDADDEEGDEPAAARPALRCERLAEVRRHVPRVYVFAIEALGGAGARSIPDRHGGRPGRTKKSPRSRGLRVALLRGEVERPSIRAHLCALSTEPPVPPPRLLLPFRLFFFFSAVLCCCCCCGLGACGASASAGRARATRDSCEDNGRAF